MFSVPLILMKTDYWMLVSISFHWTYVIYVGIQVHDDISIICTDHSDDLLWCQRISRHEDGQNRPLVEPWSHDYSY